ncbi:MobF family relaxase [Rothia mucilaginosa]|uniref:MobF family relaxase n=1 Tax=Rothia mucilaginosa TaxID=43675 RepID=UPI0028DD163E|nr:MobF family relaxase [Rothia mucilaginosa]
MMTVHKLSAGDGYKYYVNEVATGDALRAKDREIGDYYTVHGMPPGQWVGSAAASLNLDGEVSEAHMHALFGQKFTPVSTGEVLDTLHGAPVAEAYQQVYEEALEQYRSQAAEHAWELLSRVHEGMSQQKIADEMTAQGYPMSQPTVSRWVERYTSSGQTFHADRDEFVAQYRLIGEEIKAAHRAGKKAQEALYAEQAAPHVHPDYAASTDFTQRVEEEVSRHRRMHDGAEPSTAEMKEIRFRVGAQMFRDERGIEPSNAQLAQFVAQNSKAHQKAVAGYDLVFTPPKSVSIAWGLGDEQLRRGIEAAHERAIQDVIRYLEKNVVMTRRGRNGVRQIDTAGGVIGTKFRHWDSRAGDPNLHDHVVIANRVQGVDGQWSSIDGRMLYQYGVECSELYNARVQQYVTELTGLQFEARSLNGKQPVHEIVGIDDEMVRAFSSRRGEISAALEQVTAKFVDEHGYAPSEKQLIQLAQQATLATRPAKDGVHSLEELHAEWVAQAHALREQGVDLPVEGALAEKLKAASEAYEQNILQAKRQQAYESPVQEHAAAIVARLEESRSTWRRTHVNAEVLRYARDMGLNEKQDATLLDSIREHLNAEMLPLHAQSQRLTPREFMRADGTSQYQKINHELFTSERVLAAESAILDAATQQVIPASSLEVFELEAEKRRAELALQGYALPEGQERMAREFATSDKLLVVGIGAAGAGKTSSTRLAVNAIEASGGRVVGMAPTAAAAAVMREEMGIEADTVDKILSDWKNGAPVSLRAGDVLLVDEAGMVSTPKFQQILQLAQERGALVRALGDYRQLSAVGSGGALRLVDREVGAVHLDELFRFKNPDEAAATLALREPPLVGEDKPFDWYKDQGRVVVGESDVMVEQVFTAWREDTTAGKQSIMIASTNETVGKLNDLAQAHAMERGHVHPEHGSVRLHNEARAHVGDVVVTRQNVRRLTVNGGQDFVKNGDLWRVTQVHEGGAMTVQHLEHGGKVTLPAAYAAQNVELGYASTIHRSQGATVDTAHALVDSSTDRAGAYVALTRGRESNTLYVGLGDGQSRDEVLEQIANAYERDLTVHESVDAVRAEHENVADLVAQHEDISELAVQKVMAAAVHEGMGRVSEHPVRDGASGMVTHHVPADAAADAAEVLSSDAWGALAHELGEAAREGFDPADLVERAYGRRALHDEGASARDAAAVMAWRVGQIRQQAQQVRSDRPLASLSDEHLERLVQQAKQKTAPVEERLAVEDPWWFTNPYAMTKTDELLAMRARTVKALNANEGDTTGVYAQIKENLGDMDAEITRRRWEISGDQRELEQIVRGERTRSGHQFTLYQVLLEEQKIRQSLPSGPAAVDPAKVTSGGVSGYTLDRFWEQHPAVRQGRLGTILRARSREIGKLTRARGEELARLVQAGKAPAWVKALGPVPTRKRLYRKWVRAAGEADTLRKKYKVPESEPAVLPDQMVHEASQRVNNARLASDGAPVVVLSAEKTRAAEAVLGVLEQVKRVAKATRLAERAKNQKKKPKNQKVTEPEQQPKPLSPVEQKVQEARAERAPEPAADEETLAALRVSQIGMGGRRPVHQATDQGQTPDSSSAEAPRRGPAAPTRGVEL